MIDEAIQMFGNASVVAFRERSFHISLTIGRASNMTVNECDRIREIYLEFFMLGQCDMGLVSRSGFGLIGILNRKEINELSNFYVFTNPVDFNDRSNQMFVPFNKSILYREFSYLLK